MDDFESAFEEEKWNDPYPVKTEAQHPLDNSTCLTLRPNRNKNDLSWIPYFKQTFCLSEDAGRPSAMCIINGCGRAYKNYSNKDLQVCTDRLLWICVKPHVVICPCFLSGTYSHPLQQNHERAFQRGTPNRQLQLLRKSVYAEQKLALSLLIFTHKSGIKATIH